MKALICGLLSLALPLAVEVYPDSGRAEDTATPVSYSQLGGTSTEATYAKERGAEALTLSSSFCLYGTGVYCMAKPGVYRGHWKASHGVAGLRTVSIVWKNRGVTYRTPRLSAGTTYWFARGMNVEVTSVTVY